MVGPLSANLFEGLLAGFVGLLIHFHVVGCARQSLSTKLRVLVVCTQAVKCTLGFQKVRMLDQKLFHVG